MARYDHLPIYRAAFDLAVHMERIVREFSRYHKYTLGTELRNCSRGILKMIIEANGSKERGAMLLKIREELEWLKVLSRLCHESACFSGIKIYIHISEKVIDISKQNEGWIKQTIKRSSGRAGHGQNQKGN
ncbi:MAG: four helix bundle protein [bacterium]